MWSCALRDGAGNRKKTMGSDDPRIADSLQNFALAHNDGNSNPKEVEALQRQVLAIRRKRWATKAQT